jgi:hypothetical protein
MNSKTVPYNPELFCMVKAGINVCEICTNEAWYSTSIPQRGKYDLPEMELFRCGHGMCSNCLSRISVREWFCPFCRDGSKQFLSRIPGEVNYANTFSQYLYEFNNNLSLLEKSGHKFVQLHRQIIYNAKNEKKIKKKEQEQRAAQLAKENKKEEKKKMKAVSKALAVCTYCMKSTFTSTAQLKIHIQAKHPNVKDISI